ncbi:hypothetical protein PS1_032168 [Malus domestica]
MSRRKWVPNWRSKEKNESPTNPDATVVIRLEVESQLACRSNIYTEAASTTPAIAGRRRSRSTQTPDSRVAEEPMGHTRKATKLG